MSATSERHVAGARQRHALPWWKRALAALGRLVVGIVAGANLMAILALWLCALCTFVSPSTFPWAGIYCLSFPLLLLLNLLFIPVWLLLRWRMTAMPVLGVLMVWSQVQSYSPVHAGRGVEHNEEARLMKVMQYNPHHFADLNQGATSNMLFSLLERDTFDLICVQEGVTTGRAERLVSKFMKGHGYSQIRAPYSQYASSCIYSRWPVVRIDTLPLASYSGNRAMACHLRVGEDTVVVVSAHLESFRLEAASKEHYRATISHPDAHSLRATGGQLVRHMAKYMRRHGDQADTIMAYIEPIVSQGKPVLLCGDFNDSPVSYVCRRARTCMQDCFRESGRGTGFTFHEKAMPFRIDHIFASSRFLPLKTWVESSVVESDHYPIIAILDLLPKKNSHAGPKSGE